MYQFSRAIYRELEPLIAADAPQNANEIILKSCERTVERLATDRYYFAKPVRTLFNDIRCYFPITVQLRVHKTVERHLTIADQFFIEQTKHGFDINGNRLQCRATTRRGTPCQRTPIAINGYCPSHQHLVETEEVVATLAFSASHRKVQEPVAA